MKKLLVVTGGTKGIGKAVIARFARNNFDIITCSRNGQDLKRLEEEVWMEHRGITIRGIEADLSTKEGIREFTRALASREPDVLVNNTGLFIPGQVHREEEGVLEKLVETNLYSAYHVTRAVVPSMIRRRSGHIFNICSTASIMPYVNGGSYCITKYALYGMTKVLREEMKEHGVKVTAVLPGATYTASWEGVDLPEDRFMPSEDVAEAIWSAYSLSSRSVVEEILLRPQLGDI